MICQYSVSSNISTGLYDSHGAMSNRTENVHPRFCALQCWHTRVVRPKLVLMWQSFSFPGMLCTRLYRLCLSAYNQCFSESPRGSFPKCLIPDINKWTGRHQGDHKLRVAGMTQYKREAQMATLRGWTEVSEEIRCEIWILRAQVSWWQHAGICELDCLYLVQWPDFN